MDYENVHIMQIMYSEYEVYDTSQKIMYGGRLKNFYNDNENNKNTDSSYIFFSYLISSNRNTLISQFLLRIVQAPKIVSTSENIKRCQEF